MAGKTHNDCKVVLCTFAPSLRVNLITEYWPLIIDFMFQLIKILNDYAGDSLFVITTCHLSSIKA